MKITASVMIAISLLMLAAMNTVTIPHIELASGGAKIFDLRFGYTVEEASALLSQLGSEGRFYYLHTQLVLDFFYPIFFILGYSLAIYQLVKPVQPKLRALRFGGVSCCILGGCLDLAENTCTYFSLKAYPTILNTLIPLASVLTQLKFIFSSLGLMAFFIGITIFSYSKFSNLKSRYI